MLKLCTGALARLFEIDPDAVIDHIGSLDEPIAMQIIIADQKKTDKVWVIDINSKEDLDNVVNEDQSTRLEKKLKKMGMEPTEGGVMAMRMQLKAARQSNRDHPY